MKVKRESSGSLSLYLSMILLPKVCICELLASFWQVFGKSEENTGCQKTPDLFKLRMIHEGDIHPKLTDLSESCQI